MKFTRNVREDGRIEAVCEHGVGHTIKSSYKDRHGCDYCCNHLTRKAKKLLIDGKISVEVE